MTKQIIKQNRPDAGGFFVEEKEQMS